MTTNAPQPVYIIGPLTTHGELQANIEAAEKLAAILMWHGYLPTMTHHIARVPRALQAISQDKALGACEALIRHLAEGHAQLAVAVIDGAPKSQGSRREMHTALDVTDEEGIELIIPIPGRPGVASRWAGRMMEFEVRAWHWTHDEINAEWDRIIAYEAGREP